MQGGSPALLQPNPRKPPFFELPPRKIRSWYLRRDHFDRICSQVLGRLALTPLKPAIRPGVVIAVQYIMPAFLQGPGRAVTPNENRPLQTSAEDDRSLRAEEKASLHRRMRQLEGVHRLSAAVSRADNLEAIVVLALESLQNTRGADRSAILLTDAQGVMRFWGWRGLSDEYRALVEGHSPWPKDVQDPQPILMSDAELEPSLKPLIEGIRHEGVCSLGFIPLFFEGDLLGKLMVYYDRPHEYEEDEVRLAQTIANHVAFAIQRKRYEEKMQLYK
jgi:transcriptional regulator with GAF, ATPase, and Fis domain